MALDYARRIYDFWGRHPRVYWAGDWLVFLGRRTGIRQRAIDAMELRGGEAVLDLACGPGVNFPLLETAIGPSGKLTALDYSGEMLAAARARARSEDWRNLEFVRADAARAPLPTSFFDAAVCTLGLSVMPNHEAAIARVHGALRPGGRFVILDAGLVHGPGRLFNPALEQLYKYVSSASVRKDLSGALRRVFAHVRVDEFNSGMLFIAVARKSTRAPLREVSATDGLAAREGHG
jgi:demethylmenaquinone methyltransferase/2-methoxy-6-polyprenyl-1,4-benzoquinol methylase